MIILWGFRTKLLRQCYLGIRYCRRCGRFQHFYLMRAVNQFTLFFLPIFWWTKAFAVCCAVCGQGTEVRKEEAAQIKQRYASFPDPKKSEAIFEFCEDMARGQENVEENWQKLFRQVKERFDLNGFDDDFKKMIRNIFAVQEAKRLQAKIID